MPSQRDIKRRITSVQSTRQITRTMEMVATAKIRHATDRIVAATPYSESMAQTLARISEQAASIEHPLLEQRDERRTAIAIAVVSDRGLAGGFNSNIFREVERYRAANAAEGVETKVIACGKKASGYFAYRRVEPLLSFKDLSADPTLAEAREISSYVRSAFLDGQVDEVKVFYNHARNAADQDLREELILPIAPDTMTETPVGFDDGAAEEEKSAHADVTAVFDFEPSSEEVLDKLLPSYVETMIYHALIDSAAAEQGARRKAMKSATDNADEMEATLQRLFNRVRQGAITTEITEIVGGAAALEE